MKRIFLTGPIGCGKSTLIKTVLGDCRNLAGGFVTERILEGGKLTGFELVSTGEIINPKEPVGRGSSLNPEETDDPKLPARQNLLTLPATLPGLYERAGHLRLPFLTFKGDTIERSDEAFSVFASSLLREAGTKPFAVIDEIGGFEILIPEFMEAFACFLASSVPCVGVLKSLPSAEKLSKTAGLDGKYLNAAEQLRSRLTADAETEIVEVGGHGDTRALHLLKQWRNRHLDNGDGNAK